MADNEIVPVLRPADGMHGIPFGAWLVIVAVVVSAGLMGHAVLPRYDVRLIGADGHGVLIYDKWTGRVQRADFTPEGDPVLKGVITPF